MSENKNVGSGERRYDSQGAQVHQETTSGQGNYHSGERSDGSDGRFITVGDGQNHTTFKYGSDGKYEGSSTRGDGGNARDANPGGSSSSDDDDDDDDD